MQCKSLWIKASAKCINVNVIRITTYECIFVMLTELRTGGGA